MADREAEEKMFYCEEAAKALEAQRKTMKDLQRMLDVRRYFEEKTRRHERRKASEEQ